MILKKLEELEIRFNNDRPELELTVRDNELGLEGYVVVWNSKPGMRGPLGPCGKGGTRITPDVTLDEVRMLARRMALKNAAAGLAMGGAKSGFRANPDHPNCEKLYRRFAKLVAPMLVENGGVFGGFGFDIGARPNHPGIVCDELGSLRCFTGKPLEMGGTDYDREGLAGYGVVVAVDTMLKEFGEDLKKQTIAVQGLGAMGMAVSRYLLEKGAPLVAVCDPRIGGSFRLDATLRPDLLEAMQSGDVSRVGVLLKSRAIQFDLEDLIAEPVDILIPAAVQDAITADNCTRVRARYIVEAANGPCSASAQIKLELGGVRILPDFIANPGGIVAAFVELTSKVTPEENLKTRANVTASKKYIDERISSNVKRCVELSKENEIGLISAGRYLALSNIYSDWQK
jgi:glutamate dehydrogenase (NAD(P)+)